MQFSIILKTCIELSYSHAQKYEHILLPSHIIVYVTYVVYEEIKSRQNVLLYLFYFIENQDSQLQHKMFLIFKLTAE
jgi:hypothetical protein